MNLNHEDLVSVVESFQIEGTIKNVIPYGTGHINDTYRVEYGKGRECHDCILQRINHQIFTNPIRLMENVVRVTEHIREKLVALGVTDIDRHVLRVILTHRGRSCLQAADGSYWRMYRYIEKVRTRDYLRSPDQAYEAARMFGWFQRVLVDLPGPVLYETIPGFHNTPKRLKDFMLILQQDPYNRAGRAKEEIQFVCDHANICDRLCELAANGSIPERITHNDTKINNVLFDTMTEKGLCVIDLDTVMPGLSLYDFGDMVRTATCRAAEDERDLSKVGLEIRFFEQLAKGYASQAAGFLNDTEKKHLVFSGKLITFEQMIRFLSDYLNGDVYYKTHRPEHNLDRTRTQMKLVQSIQAQEEQMNRFAEKVWAMTD